MDRADFIPAEYKRYSDVDEPLPIPSGQMQSAPHMNAIFVSYGEPKGDQAVLEIGTGSGYLTTILSFLCDRVVSAELLPELSRMALSNMAKYDRRNVDLVTGNINTMCFREKFDLIISTASFKREPEFIRAFAKSGGTVIFPLGSSPPQRLIRYRGLKREELGSVAFVNIMD